MKLFKVGFVDQDGVLADFIRKALFVHGKIDMAQNMDLYDFGKDVEVMLDMADTEEKKTKFWQRIMEAGSSFWVELEKFSYAEEVIHAVASVCDEVKILTSPSRDQNPDIYWGKRKWLINKGRVFSDLEFIPCRSKYLLARHDRLLVDYNPEQVKQFQEYGGHAILFPSISNEAHVQVKSVMFHFGRSLYALEEAVRNVRTTTSG